MVKPLLKTFPIGADAAVLGTRVRSHELSPTLYPSLPASGAVQAEFLTVLAVHRFQGVLGS